ncbi:2-amino-4-oxopentanoate thiolase subunit OrtA [Neobacillus niacini]|uniref:2-amino-4-oxopentanoate thiolase subunit OrtA n=1 Tax=Neobacillus niacini TaxID=86668 RepID=UPI0021CB46A9|nr:2-amino-4-oxopentanoate thiolase subunit OrtA [Neobacillus niacini]MCM3766035.1 2-amino-4-oxopentanoate thiolase subunit OrtA [Neobacillus niacini]
MEQVNKGTWVEIHRILLQPEERSDRLPEDSKSVPYEMRARGFLLEEALLNDEVTIKTLSGRVISGRLIQIEPCYEHSYGPPVYELLNIGDEEKRMLETK